MDKDQIKKLIEFAWFAGLFEGEGCVFTPDMGKKSKYPSVSITMHARDKAILERVQRIAGGHVFGPYHYGGRSPQCQWKIGAQYDIHNVCKALYPFMSERRKKQIDKYFRYYNELQEVKEMACKYCA